MWEHIGITASFGNVADSKNTFHDLKAIDETRGKFFDEVSEFFVPGVHFYRQ